MIQRLARMIVPATCAACCGPSAPDRSVCDRCLGELDRSGPIQEPPVPGVGTVSSVAPHSGVARSILAAYKFQRLFGLGDFIAARICEIAPVDRAVTCVVPVPAAGRRLRLRGFDPAEEISLRVAAWVGLPFRTGTLIRVGASRQRGKARDSRLADPPKIEARGGHTGTVLLIDDVLTTGATLTACAEALNRCGAGRIVAATFTRRL